MPFVAIPVNARVPVMAEPVLFIKPLSKLTVKATLEVPSVPSTGLATEMVAAAVSASKIFSVAAVVFAVTNGSLVAVVNVAITVSVNSIELSSTTVRSIVVLLEPAAIVAVPITVEVSV